MRLFLCVAMALYLVGFVYAQPPQAPNPPQAPAIPDCCRTMELVSVGTPLDTLSAALAVVTQPGQAPEPRSRDYSAGSAEGSPKIKSGDTVFLPAGVLHGVVVALPSSNSYLPRYRIQSAVFTADPKATSTPVEGGNGPVWVPSEAQADYLARGWRFIDGGGLSCASGSCALSGTLSGGAYYEAPALLGDSGGCSNGSCGTSSRRGLFGRRR